MHTRDWNRIVAGLLAAPIPFMATAHAETYLNETQAAAILFPGVRLEPRWMDLTPEESNKINKASGQAGLDSHIRIFWGPNKEALVIDQVLGKHEFITYAVAIDAQSKVKGIEIMDYRETYGYQVRGADWRKQFVGKSLQDPLTLDKDIRNISGATLSSKHVTEGVRRVLIMYDVLKAKNS